MHAHIIARLLFGTIGRHQSGTHFLNVWIHSLLQVMNYDTEVFK